MKRERASGDEDNDSSLSEKSLEEEEDEEEDASFISSLDNEQVYLKYQQVCNINSFINTHKPDVYTNLLYDIRSILNFKWGKKIL